MCIRDSNYPLLKSSNFIGSSVTLAYDFSTDNNFPVQEGFRTKQFLFRKPKTFSKVKIDQFRSTF